MFKPGKSGNPNGRPKVDMEMRALAQKEGVNSLRTLIEIRDDIKAGKGYRIMAAQVLLDRGFGKAPQAVNVTSDVPYVLLAPQPISNADTWLTHAKSTGMDVPSPSGYDPNDLN